ncbi:MAG: hypothetical protein DMG40_24395 [Acidobacteria bacterium]|nr:MAG: hypothetical protein DMG40_24395 [Acidobacteriota bacterium]
MIHVPTEIEARRCYFVSRYFSRTLPKTLSAHTNALIGKLIADGDQFDAAKQVWSEAQIGKCK